MARTRSLPMLGEVRVASPCHMKWEEMEGDERRRYCGACQLHVHNLSALTGAEAEALVQGTLGNGERLCGVFYRRADGTVLTRDCPVGLAALKARVRRRVGRITAALGLVTVSGALAAGADGGAMTPRLRVLRPFAIISAWLVPARPVPGPLPPPGGLCMGKIGAPAAPGSK